MRKSGALLEKMFLKPGRQWRCSPITFLVVYCVLNSALFQLPLYVRAVQTLGTFGMAAALSLTTLFVLQLTVSLAALTALSLISVRLMQWTCIGLALGSSVALYFIVAYGVILDKSMMGNVLSTRFGEAKDLFQWRLLVFVASLGVLPAAVMLRTEIANTSRGRILRFGVLAVAAGVGWIYANGGSWLWLDKNAKVLGGLILPWSYVVNTVRYYEGAIELRAPALLPAPTAMRPGKVIVLLVIGESARAQNFSLYGYARDTNPLLSRERLVTMPKTRSCSTYTTQSLRCILSRAGEQAGTRVSEEILPNYLQRNGVDVIWRSNNFGEPALHIASRLSADDIRSECHDAACQRLSFDEVLLFNLEKQIRQSKSSKVLIVLHTAGSHGPEYFRKYPPGFEVFKPACATVDQQRCKPQELVNSYDNTIVYTDFVLSKAIQVLKSLDPVPSVMLYVSDHGESLGEYGLYLHGTPYSIAPAFQTQVPFLIWMSDSFLDDRKLHGTKIDALPEYSQGFIFHSVMGALGIRSSAYDERFDVFAGASPVH